MYSVSRTVSELSGAEESSNEMAVILKVIVVGRVCAVGGAKRAHTRKICRGLQSSNTDLERGHIFLPFHNGDTGE